MSTPILGPLQNGTRIQFAIEYDLPSNIDENYGNIVMIDSLPNGLSWYSTNNVNHKNKIIIGNIQQIVNVDFRAINNQVKFTIPNSILRIPNNVGKKLFIEIDAVISNASAITAGATLTNSASLSFTGIDVSGNGSSDFILQSLGNANKIQISPLWGPMISPGGFIVLSVIFTASNTTDNFNYDILCDFGDNLIFNPTELNNYILYYYEYISQHNIEPVTIQKDKLLANAYHFIFANNASFANKLIYLEILSSIKADNSSAFMLTTIQQPIMFSGSVSIGGASQKSSTIELPIYCDLNITKSVVQQPIEAEKL